MMDLMRDNSVRVRQAAALSAEELEKRWVVGDLVAPAAPDSEPVSSGETQ
jgi:hypothetical protein